MTSEKYYYNLSKGLCTKCSKPNDNGKSKCDSCNDRANRLASVRMQKRRSNGICLKCGKANDTSASFCSTCGEKRRESQRILRAKRKQNGLCTHCGRPTDGGSNCKECLQYIKDLKQCYVDAGLCYVCQKNPIYANERRCYQCIENARTTNANYREAHKDELLAKSSIRSKARISSRREQGLCTKCGKRKNDFGYSTCGLCRAKARQQNRERHGYGMRMIYPEGKCYICGNDCYKTYKVCEKHYDKMVDMANLPQTIEARNRLKKQLH